LVSFDSDPAAGSPPFDPHQGVVRQIDYGAVVQRNCSRSDGACHHWKDAPIGGQRKVQRAGHESRHGDMLDPSSSLARFVGSEISGADVVRETSGLSPLTTRRRQTRQRVSTRNLDGSAAPRRPVLASTINGLAAEREGRWADRDGCGSGSDPLLGPAWVAHRND
jgi:hypothetical protein